MVRAPIAKQRKNQEFSRVFRWRNNGRFFQPYEMPAKGVLGVLGAFSRFPCHPLKKSYPASLGVLHKLSTLRAIGETGSYPQFASPCLKMRHKGFLARVLLGVCFLSTGFCR